MKVLQLHTAYRQRGGEDAVVEAEAQMLRNAGHEVVQLIARNPDQSLPALAALVQAPWNASSVRAVRRAVEEHRPDVAHVHNTWFALSAGALGPLRDGGVPTVATLHNYRLACISSDLFRDGRPCTDCLGHSPAPGVVHRCYRGSRLASAAAATELAVNRRRGTWPRSVDRFIAPTDFAADLLVRAGVDRRRLTTKPHFAFDPGPRRQPCRASAEVLFVGRLAEGKGIEDLLTAWDRMRSDSLELTVVGDGPLRAAAEQLAPPGVRIVGRLAPAAVRERMLSARALVFPSTWYEPFGMVVIEALAACLPVVGYDTAAVAGFVRSSRPDLLVPTGDVDRLAGALRALADDATVEELSRRARQRFLEAFSPEQNLPQLEAIYRSVTAV